MPPCIVKIRSSKGCRRFLFLCRSFSIGVSKNDDLIVNHPSFLKRGIQICDGQIVDPGLGSEGKGNNESTDKQVRFEAEKLIIQCWTPNLKWYFLLSIMALGIILPTLFFLINPSKKLIQDWTEIDLPSQGIYGFLKQDRSHSEGVRFRFTMPWQGQNNLTFTPGSESGSGSLGVSIDGHDLFSDIALPQGWGGAVNLTIPSSFSKRDSHILEIRPDFPEGSISHWGIRDVRIVPFHAGEKRVHNITDDIGRVRATLEDPMAQGPDYSYCYITLTDHMQGGETDDMEKLKTLRQAVESRMHDLANAKNIRIRSFIFSGQTSEAKQMMGDLREWIPETWTDGEKMLLELERILK